MPKMWFGWLLTSFLMTVPAFATPVSLDELMAVVDTDPAVLAAQAEYTASLADASARRIESGPQVFMNASAGHYLDLNSANLINSYYSRNVAIGLRFPLLGTLRRQLDSLASTRFETQRKQLQVALRRAERRLALKIAYAEWWRAQQENVVCRSFGKQANAALGQLQQRREAGWLRTSEALSESMKWKDLLTRCDTAARAEGELKAYLAMLAGRSLPADAQAGSVTLYVDPAPLGDWQEQIDQQPGIRSQQATVAENRQLKERSWYNSVDASLSLGYATEDRSGISSFGNNFVAALNFSIPFEIGGHATATGNAAAARYQAARYRLEAERRQLIVDVSAILRAQRQAYQTLTQQQKRVAVAQARFSEQKARIDLDSENGIMLRQVAERDYYQTQLDYIAGWYGLWSQQAALQMFTDDNEQAAHLLGRSTITWSLNNEPAKSALNRARRSSGSSATILPVAAASQAATGRTMAVSEPARQAGWTVGTYVWNSRPLLDVAQRTKELDALRAAGMGRIYLGLDASQVASIADTKRALGQVIVQAKAQGIAVSLLLGDPQWLAPEHRDNLIALIRSLADLPFASLHLDLEVEQLGWPVPDSRLTLWMDTLRAVHKVSPWPIELSSHPRWFEAPKNNSLCIPCQLPQLGVITVSLMIYTRNTDRSTALMLAAARRWPALKFRLAQSMEPELTQQESWAAADGSQIRGSLSKWRKELSPSGIQGVDWQAWADYPRHDASSR